MQSRPTLFDYRAFLRKELRQRQQRNPAYSQRAFAKSLGIRSNRLSEIVSGKQGISPKLAQAVSLRLEAGPRERALFCESVKSHHARTKLQRAEARARLEALAGEKQYRSVELDTFRLISGWEHLAILEMLKVTDCKGELGAIARKLGLSESKVRTALSRMLRLGLVKTCDGKWIAEDHSINPSAIPTNAIKRFHENVMRLAIAALYSQKVEAREFSTTFLAINREQLPAIKERVRDFWKGIDQEFGDKKDATDVYSVGVQFFNLGKEI